MHRHNILNTPHGQATAYRIWAAAEPLGWDITVWDLARQIGISPKYAGRVVAAKGWTTRFRVGYRLIGHQLNIEGRYSASMPWSGTTPRWDTRTHLPEMET